MDSFKDLEKKTLSKSWGDKKNTPDYEVYKKDNNISKSVSWQNPKKRRYFKKIRNFKFIWFLLFLFFGAWASYQYYFSVPIFNKEDVKMYIAGPKNVTSGEEVSFKVSYRNDSKVVLRNAELEFEWPEGSSFDGLEYSESVVVKKNVGILMPNQEKIVILEGRIYGDKGSSKEIKARLSYVPGELGRVVTNEKNFNLVVEAVPISLKVTLADQVVSDKESEIRVEYINQSSASFSSVEIRLEYPSGFEFVSSDPNPAISDNVWQLGTVQENEEGEILIRGKFNGVEGEKQLVSVEIGQAELSGDGFSLFADSIEETQIASSALLVFQTVNGSRESSVSFGDTLNYRINYKNTTNSQISNVVILAQIDDKLVDLKTLNMSWGSFDGRTNSIIWNQSGVPGLAVLDPKEEGSVSFSVKAKKSEEIPFLTNRKNIKISSSVKIASGAVPDSLDGLPVEGQDSVDVKLNTSLNFNVLSYFSNGPIKNKGTLPPKVGSEVTYAVSWQITNTINDVKDVVVRAFIPPNVKWTGVVDPVDSGIVYDAEKGIIEWRPGIVFAGSGYTVPSQRVDFQLSFFPAITHVGKLIELVSSAELEGVDVFTGNKIMLSAKAVDSTLNGTIDTVKAKVIQ